MQTDPPAPEARQFGREIIEALEQTQTEIGDTLHGTLCQTLSGAALMARVLAGRAASGEPVSAAELAQVADQLDRSLEDTRALMHQLQPLQAGPTALMAALERLAAGTARTVPCEFRCEEPVFVHDLAAGLTLYRIADAAVRDALESVPAAHLLISLAAVEGAVKLVVRAHGSRAVPALAEGRRLQLMRQRAEVAGGVLRSERSADGDVQVICRLPIGG